MIQKPVLKPAAVKPAAQERVRAVKRHKAICPYTTEHDIVGIFTTRAAAEVASVRHIRSDHVESLTVEVTANKRTRIIREEVGLELA